MKKIAFLFLIYDEINIEELWKIFFDKVDKDKYNIYIHYKTDKPLKYFEKYKLKNCIQTSYADISLVLAQNLLIKEAMKDEDNQHFIFLSNSCVPFKSFEHIYNNLSTYKSYFNLSPHEQCFPRCNELLNFIDKQNIRKASQWCILNRKHCTIMIENTKYTEHYKNIYAPEEIYYITNIYINNLQDEVVITLNLADDATTFTNWQGMKYKFPSEEGLKNYSFIKEEEIKHLINSKCFFGRKFNKQTYICLVKILRNILNS